MGGLEVVSQTRARQQSSSHIASPLLQLHFTRLLHRDLPCCRILPAHSRNLLYSTSGQVNISNV